MQGGKQIFIHIKAFSNRDRRPAVGQIVTYEQSSDKQGRPCAISATLTGERLPKKSKPSKASLSVVTAVAFLFIVGSSVLFARTPVHILALYITASLLNYIMYAIDKSAAQRGKWRTRESTLHLLSLVGGWPGALIAQQTLRHKSRKQSFRSVFWLTVILNCGAFAWFFTPNGANTLHALIDTIL